MGPRKRTVGAIALGIAVLAALAAIYAGYVRGDMSDFGVPYRNAERILQGETLYRPSDGHLQYKYAPASALFYVPLALLPLETAKIIWYGLEVILLAGICAVGWRILPRKRKSAGFVIGFGFLASLKFLGREIELGQVNLLIIFLLVLMVGTYLAKRDAWAGCFWALSIFFKPYALVFLPYFVLKKRWKPLLSGLAVLGGGGLLPAVFYGFRGNLVVHREWIDRLSDSTPGLLAVGDNASLLAFFLKLFPGFPETIFQIAWAAAGFAIAALFLWMMRTAKAGDLRGAEVLEASFLLVLIPLFSPLGWYYNYLYALPAFFVLLNAWPLLSGTWKGVLAADFLLISGTLREILGKTLFDIYQRRSWVVVNFIIVLAALAHLRARKID